MSILLQDSGGGIWSVGTTANGQITTTPSGGVPMIAYLRDPGSLVWLLGISTIGLLTLTQAPSNSTPQYLFISLGGTPSWNLSMNSIGQLETHSGWVPNGFGSGTDNSVVGGGGGFMAYPQPPTGPNAAFFPPDRNGQFGPTNLVFNNGIGTYFTVSNPGRSTNQ